MKAAKVHRVRVADAFHNVVTAVGEKMLYRRRPCAKCPWRTDTCGEFPAEAFRLSARTSHDQSMSMFGCHESGLEKPVTCAGFLLRGADHNLLVRVQYFSGAIKDDVSDGGHPLHESYRAMAIANGVPEDDPALTQCRDPGY